MKRVYVIFIYDQCTMPYLYMETLFPDTAYLQDNISYMIWSSDTNNKVRKQNIHISVWQAMSACLICSKLYEENVVVYEQNKGRTNTCLTYCIILMSVT